MFRLACGVGFAFVAAVGLAAPASAEVVDVGANGFTVKVTATIAALESKVFVDFVTPEKWWNPSHTFGGDASTLVVDGRAGGCFCEELPGGGQVEHMTVVLVDPGKRVVMRGALGPFQEMGVDGALTLALAAGDGGTTVATLTYALGGYSPQGFGDLSKAADGMLTETIGRLKAFAETGSVPKP